MRFYKRFVFNVSIVRVVTRLSFYNKVYARFEVFMRFYKRFVFERFYSQSLTRLSFL